MADEPITPTADETVFSTETPTDPDTTPPPAEPEPEPVDPALAMLGKVVTWHEPDEWGNPRTRVGVLIGEHTWLPGKYEVVRLPRDNRGFDLADLAALPDDARPLLDS